jgi:hypothetical protein
VLMEVLKLHQLEMEMLQVQAMEMPNQAVD